MNNISDSKIIINEEINKIFLILNNEISKFQSETKFFSFEVERLNKFNEKLLNETRETDKLLSQKDKTIHDYELMIHNLENSNKKELNNKERFDIIRNQDKVINDQNKKIEKLENDLSILNNTNISFNINDNINNDNNQKI